MTFAIAVAFVLKEEGGFQKDPSDGGNWTGGKPGVGKLVGTNMGISAASFPNLDIEHLTLARAHSIYDMNYWLPAHCAGLPDVLRLMHLDTAVNCGVGEAIRLLQMSARTHLDGVWGPVTSGAVARTDATGLLEDYTANRLHRYARLAADMPSRYRADLPGWVLRTLRARLASKQEAPWPAT